MDYNNTRSKKIEPEPQSEVRTIENSIADIPCGLQSDQSNSSKKDKTKEISQSESTTTMITKITNGKRNINHNLDVFKQNIREDTWRFNKHTILMVDMGLEMHSDRSGAKYHFVCKIGYGGFSIVWLVVDMYNRDFKVAKVFKYGYSISKLENYILQKQITINHPNIIRFYEYLSFNIHLDYATVAIYEPMGKNLYTLMKEAAKHGGLSISVAKKVAKHILLALKTLDYLAVVHSDIKLQNIAVSGSQVNLRHQLEKIVESMKSGKNLSSLRMVCDKSKFDVNINGKLLEESLDKVSKEKMKDEPELIFKLIDFGNVLENGTESPTGTYGFHPPEYCFGAPLLRSHDIWSLGVTIVVILTNKNFLKFAFSEIASLRKMFGKFSRSHFKDFKDSDGYKTKFTTEKYNSEKAEKQVKKLLKNKLKKLRMHEDDRQNLIDFLIHMFNTVPSERKSAADLLSHPWLNDVMERGEDQYEHKLNSENDNFDLSNKFSAASIIQEQQTNIAAICHREAENYDGDNELDSDETEEDSNETIIEFSSDDESYVEGDASHGPPFESFSDKKAALDDSFSV